jgi:hypothetical protein
MRSLHAASPPGVARVVTTCAAIMRTEGLRGFYVGLWPNMLQVRTACSQLLLNE